MLLTNDYGWFSFHQAACETFCVGDANTIQDATGAFSSTDFSWSQGKFRLTPEDNNKEMNITEGILF